MANIFFDRTNDAGSGTFYSRTNDATAGVSDAAGSGVTDNATAPGGSAVGYGITTLADPIWLGVGSIVANGFVGTPVAGDIWRWPTANGFVGFPDSTFDSDSNATTVTCYYTSLDGTYVDYPFDLIINNVAYVSGTGVTDTTTAPTGTAFGGSLGSAGGAGVTDTATAPTGTAQAGAITTGAGVTDTTAAPTGGAQGAAAATGVGTTDTTNAPDGFGSGGQPGIATAGGATDNTIAPNGTVQAGAQITSPGMTDTSTAPQGSAVGASSVPAPGATDTTLSPAGSAQGGAATQVAGTTDITAAPNASATGGAVASGAGATAAAVAPGADANDGIGRAVGEGFAVMAEVATGFADATPQPVYGSRNDMIKRFGLTEITQLTDKEDLGTVDDGVLAQALADADAEIDGYLQGRYTLPLASTPRMLIGIACDVARYRLYDDRATEQVTKRYDDAIKFLSMVAQGKIGLGMPSDSPVTTAGGPACTGEPRVFTTTTLKDFL